MKTGVYLLKKLSLSVLGLIFTNWFPVKFIFGLNNAGESKFYNYGASEAHL